MKAVALSLAIAGAATTAHAANITFVGENGSGDLSETANWNGNTKPGASDTAVFDTSGTLTSTDLFSPNGYTFKGTGLSWTIQSASLGTSRTGASDAFVLGSGSETDNLGGNTLILGSGANIQFPAAGFMIGKSSAAVTTGSNGGNTLRIESGARLWVGRQFTLGGLNSPTNRLVVASGGVLDLTWTGSGWQTMAFGGQSYGNTTDIYGKCVSTQNYEYVCVGYGAPASNNVLTCHNGSYFETKGNVYVGWTGSHNTLRVADGATFRQSNGTSRFIYIGNNGESCDNRLIVENGNDISFKALAIVGYNGSDNLLLVTNGTAAVSRATIGSQASATGNVFKWAGDSCLSDVELDNVAFGVGSNNKFIIDGLDITCKVSKANFTYKTGSGNKVILRNAKLTTCGQMASTMTNGNALVLDNSEWNHVVNDHARAFLNQNCILTLVNNAVANFNRDSFYFGNATANSRNNLNILSGSTANFNTFRLQMDNNRVVISNATMTVNHPNGTYYLPFYNGKEYLIGSTNNTFRFEGSSPSLEITAAEVKFWRHLTEDKVDVGATVLEYSLPAEAYAVAPLRTAALVISRSNKIRVELNGEQARTQKYTLAETSTGTITVEDMADLGSELPANCKLSLSEDSKKLILKASVPCGMVILLR